MDLMTAKVEVDGVEYATVMAGSCCPSSQSIAPGATSQVTALTYPNGLHAPGGTLFIAPGRHTVRLKASVGRSWNMNPNAPSAPAASVIEVTSNLLTIDIPFVDPAVEQQALVDAAVRSGNAGPALVALVEKYPEAALGAVRQMLDARSGDAFNRANLIAWLYRVPGEEAMAFFRTQVGPETELASRSAAAWNLFRRGDREGVTAAIAAWRELQVTRLTPASLPDRSAPIRDQNTRYAAGSLITTLANSADAAAIDALARDLKQMPLEVRMSAVGVFIGPETGQINTMLNGGPGTLPDGLAENAILKLLFLSLDDREVMQGKKGTIAGMAYVNPRVCDLAALVLTTRWPQRFVFRWDDDTSGRDAQIEGIRRRTR